MAWFLRRGVVQTGAILCFLFRNPNSGRQVMLDRDTKELLLGFTAIVIFAVAIVYLRQ
jgi:hypothetical protein